MALVDVVTLPPRLANLLAHARPTQGELGRYEIRNADGAEAEDAELVLYSEIGGWFGASDAAFAEALSGITAKRLTVRLNSPGGSVFQGIAIANLLRSHPAYVTVSVDGLAASIASVIAIAGDEVIAQPQSQFMVHKASGLCLGNDDDMEEMRDLLRRQSENIARAYAARIPGSRWDTWYNRMAAESWYSAEEAVAVGLADRVASYARKEKPAEDEPEPEAEPEEDVPAAAKTGAQVWDLSVFRYAGRAGAPDPMAEPPAANDGQAPPADGLASVGTSTTASLKAATSSRTTGPTVRVTLDTSAVRAAVRAELNAAGLAIVDTACPSHSTGAEEGTWSKSENESRLPSPMPLATAKRFYGAYDADRIEDGKIPKDAGSLPHHFVGEDGTPGKASISGVHNALARLNQTHGLSAEDRAAVERHLRGHLPSGDSDDRADADPTPPAATPDPWGAATRHLTTTPADGWADATAQMRGA